jgi:N-acetylmuramoyl-L-alanine amidase
MRAIRKIVVHHSASPPVSMEKIDEWHKERGFSEVGYHYVIQAGGLVRLGRKVAQIGAHCKGHNSDSIGVCVVGSFEDGTPVPGSQWVALVSVVSDLMRQYGLSVRDVYGHKELGNTLCPGFDPVVLREALADECEV